MADSENNKFAASHNHSPHRYPNGSPTGDEPPQPPKSEPAINLPPVMKWITAGLILVKLAMDLLPPDLVESIAVKMAFFPARYSSAEMLWHDPIASFLSPIAHTFLHFDWLHLFSNLGMFLAFGTALYRLIGPEKLLLIWVIGALAGVMAVTASDPNATSPMMGASDSISAVLGALVYISWRFAKVGIPVNMPFASKERILTFVLIWVGMNLLFIVIPYAAGVRIAWEAHIAGFVSGVIAAYCLFKFHRRRP